MPNYFDPSLYQAPDPNKVIDAYQKGKIDALTLQKGTEEYGAQNLKNTWAQGEAPYDYLQKAATAVKSFNPIDEDRIKRLVGTQGSQVFGQAVDTATKTINNPYGFIKAMDPEDMKNILPGADAGEARKFYQALKARSGQIEAGGAVPAVRFYSKDPIVQKAADELFNQEHSMPTALQVSQPGPQGKISELTLNNPQANPIPAGAQQPTPWSQMPYPGAVMPQPTQPPQAQQIQLQPPPQPQIQQPPPEPQPIQDRATDIDAYAPGSFASPVAAMNFAKHTAISDLMSPEEEKILSSAFGIQAGQMRSGLAGLAGMARTDINAAQRDTSAQDKINAYLLAKQNDERMKAIEDAIKANKVSKGSGPKQLTDQQVQNMVHQSMKDAKDSLGFMAGMATPNMPQYQAALASQYEAMDNPVVKRKFYALNKQAIDAYYSKQSNPNAPQNSQRQALTAPPAQPNKQAAPTEITKYVNGQQVKYRFNPQTKKYDPVL